MNSINSPEGMLKSPPPTRSAETMSPPSAPPIPPHMPAFLPPAALSFSQSISQDEGGGMENTANNNTNRSALLESICNFNKTGLRKVNLND